ncbi:MAG: hypothetical protein ACYCZX_15570 [Rhodospirillaceae bacterium]
MTLRNTIFASAALAGGILCANAARAEMTCATYLRGSAAQDSYVLNEAVGIAARLIASDWSSPAMLTDAKEIASATDLRQRLILRQLSRDCRALPRESIDKLVSIHLQAFRGD